MKRYFYYVYHNGVPCGGGSHCEAEILAKKLKKNYEKRGKFLHSKIRIEKTTLRKTKSGWKNMQKKHC